MRECVESNNRLFQVIKDSQVHLVYKDLEDLQALLEDQDLLDHPVRPVHQVLLVIGALQDLPGLKASLVTQVKQIDYQLLVVYTTLFQLYTNFDF